VGLMLRVAVAEGGSGRVRGGGRRKEREGKEE